MTEYRITEGGTFGPVFASGVLDDHAVTVTEGIVEITLLRYDTILAVEMTVDAAQRLAGQLAAAITQRHD